jgi:hypothetical protein
MLRKLREILSGRDSSGDAGISGLESPPARQSQFDGWLLDRKREDVYALMHQQMSSLR